MDSCGCICVFGYYHDRYDWKDLYLMKVVLFLIVAAVLVVVFIVCGGGIFGMVI